MSRLRATLNQLKASGEKAMGLFVTDGFPTKEATVPILHALSRGGADFIELGMPFSDPLAEGLPIQRSSARALANGVTMASTLDTVARFRAESDTPLLLMGYLNPILQYGPREFCRDAAEAGVDGLILPDLPVQEAGLISDHVRESDLDLVYLIAPNTSDDRIQKIDEASSGFVYAVSVSGLTGSSVNASQAISSYLKRARELITKNPLLVGFGIRTHQDAMELSEHTDGFIVGSALINRLTNLWNEPEHAQNDRLQKIEDFAYMLKYGTTPASSTG